MKNPRQYGKPPFGIAVIHGGPGAPGEMAPVARELSCNYGILEPLQTAESLEGQVEELQEMLKKNGELPAVLIGWSWGAILGYITTARKPSMVKKLIMIGSAVFTRRDAENITQTRLNRLSREDKVKVKKLEVALNDTFVRDKDTIMLQLGELISKADSYSPIPHENEILECRYHIFKNVWKDAVRLRESGELLEVGKKIECPVIAIHGDYDPHPAGRVRESLSSVLKDFRFILLEKCGHNPWYEHFARDKFYQILREELG